MSGTPAGPRRVRFVVLCLARTGSSHLVALLDSHPDVRCFGEILNLTHPKAAPEGALSEAATDDPVAHATALLAAGEEPARGFKLPANSLEQHPPVADWVSSELDLRIIRLVRSDPLALLLSRRLLRATLVSQTTEGSYGETTVEIEPAGAILALERIEREDEALDRLAAGHPLQRIEYEALVAGEGLADLQRFLGVEPAPLRSPYRRLRERSMADSISNWTELRRALAETRFAPLVEERAAPPGSP